MASVLLVGLLAPAAAAHPEEVSDGSEQTTESGLHLDGFGDLSSALSQIDATSANVISAGPTAKVTKNLDLRGRGVRNVGDATTDVWAHNGYAYTGTFSNPCGGDPEAGVWVWDASNKNKVGFVGIIPSPTGSRANDVKVAAMNSGDVLVHSNESCGGGPGGFEIYNVDDPANPTHLASVGPIDELNAISNSLFGGITDVGVHNLWLFTDGGSDYVAVVAESAFDTFRIYDITDPTNPTLASAWGAEEVFDPGVGDELVDVVRVLNAAIWLTEGFGASQNRFLHDVTISADGNHAYLSSWDAGLILLDISDPTNPQYVSTALDPTADGDGEVNSHAAWPSEDGSIVVETNEDFSPFSTTFTIDTGPNVGSYGASEGAITSPIVDEPGATMSGSTTYVGGACSPIAAGSGIALIQRGACAFSDKINNADAAGYSGVVVFNDAARGDALVTMGGVAVNLPGVFVGHSTGLAIAGVATAGDLVIGAVGEAVSASVVPDGWGQVRIWDYSDPTNPVLASSFDTLCSASVIDPSCDPNGTYSVHNVVVETTDNKVKAYISWYWDGLLTLDVTDPYNPAETARFLDNSTNDGLANDFWGVYKIPDDPFIFASDRNGGLYILKEQGSGSGK